MEQNNGNTPNQPTDSSDEAGVENTTTSIKKVESNRKNARKSTGPKTEAGKARSSQNAYKHGLFSKRLHPTAEQRAQDGEDYQELLEGLLEHYRPVGYLESLLAERIAAGYLRSARLLGQEQKILSFRHPFEARSSSTLPRYQATVERQLAKDIERLEALQAKRKAADASDESAQDVGPVDGSQIELAPETEAEPPSVSPSLDEKIAETNPNSSEPRASESEIEQIPSSSELDKIAETNPKSTSGAVIREGITQDSGLEAAK
jgi:hypothetical protein